MPLLTELVSEATKQKLEELKKKLRRRKMDYLEDQLKTARNLIDIALSLISTGNKHLLSTCLELLFLEVQAIIEENCVENDESSTSKADGQTGRRP